MVILLHIYKKFQLRFTNRYIIFVYGSKYRPEIRNHSPPSFVLSEERESPLWALLMTTVNKLYRRLAHTFSTRASFAAKNQPNGWSWTAFETREFRFLHTVRNIRLLSNSGVNPQTEFHHSCTKSFVGIREFGKLR